jgi:hypothetical protein
MKPNLPRLVVSILVVVFLASCNLPTVEIVTQQPGILATSVELTLVAMTQEAQLTPGTSPETPSGGETAVTSLPTSSETTNPTNTPFPTETTGPTETPLSSPGSIGGSISGYPYGSLPSLAIVAYLQEAPYNYSYMISAPGQVYFEMSSSYLIPGHYQVIAYDSSGHKGACSYNVVVVSNETVNCEINSWGGGYRDKPSGVPNP